MYGVAGTDDLTQRGALGRQGGGGEGWKGGWGVPHAAPPISNESQGSPGMNGHGILVLLL